MSIRRRDVLTRGAAAWFVLIAVEIAHGVARALWLVPLVGDWRSRQIGVGTGTLINFAVAAIFVRWIRPRSTGDALRVGALWLVLTVTFELAFGRFVAHASWQRIGADYDLLHGGLLPIGLLLLGLAPLVTAKLRRLL